MISGVSHFGVSRFDETVIFTESKWSVSLDLKPIISILSPPKTKLFAELIGVYHLLNSVKADRFIKRRIPK
tara:strand:+ start:10053 stop:10265 length:213 start_codon:yes stop_codon:yes gene_type:complete